jgi:hypothetical protein
MDAYWRRVLEENDGDEQKLKEWPRLPVTIGSD